MSVYIYCGTKYYPISMIIVVMPEFAQSNVVKAKKSSASYQHKV